MNRCQQLLADSKTQDILKSGASKETIKRIVLEITAVSDIDALNNRFSYKLHKKYQFHLPNIKTLVAQAVFYLKHQDPTQPSNYRLSSADYEDAVTLSSDELESSSPVIRITEGDASPKESGESDSEEEDDVGEDENTWEVIDIYDHFVDAEGVKKYRVQWKTDDRGEWWSDSENWVLESAMNCPDLLGKYEAKLKDNRNKKRTLLSKAALAAKRRHEKQEEVKLRIADDKDICTSSDDGRVEEHRKRRKQEYVKKMEKPETRRKANLGSTSSDTDDSSVECTSSRIDTNKPTTSKDRSRTSSVSPKAPSISSDEDEELSETLESVLENSESPNQQMTVDFEQISIDENTNPIRRPISDEEVASWTDEWYSQAESGETRAMENNIKPHQCLLYQKSTDPNGFGRCLFVYLVDNELKGDFVHFPFTGEHAVLMRQLLDTFLESVQEMGIAYELHLKREKEEFEKQKLSQIKKEH